MPGFILDWLSHLLHPTREDVVTSMFDLIFVYSGIQNVRKLIQDKEVKGFDWKNMCLYSAWNIWSMIAIYPAAELYLANAINFIYLMSQLVWIRLYLKYKYPHFNKSRISGAANNAQQSKNL